MVEINAIYKELEENFISWAGDEQNIRAAVVVGSRARDDHPPDDWSDLDIIFFSRDVNRYLYEDDWLDNIGKPVMSFFQSTPIPGGMEHRVLFEDGYDVDFVVVPLDKFDEIANHPQVPILFHRGIRTIIDKDRLIEKKLESDFIPPRIELPDESEFLNLVKNFLYHCIWTAKKLSRGELFTAKSCLDMYIKWNLLLTMTRWHTHTIEGWDVDTWHGARFFEEWADPRILKGLKSAFAYYDKKDMWRALFSTMELFRWLAIETAENLEYQYPTFVDNYIYTYVEKFSTEKRDY